MPIKAVGFDFFGTLVDANADEKSCVLSMCSSLIQCGFEITEDDFISNYRAVVMKHRETRYESLVEVDNCIWVADTLKNMGIEAEASSPEIASAVEKYFSPWTLTLADDSYRVLNKLSKLFKIGLVSNFTNSEFINESLRALGIRKFFDIIIDSDSFGMRKPHPSIFKQFLRSLGVKAEEAVFIGDDVDSDVKGARAVGIKAVLLTRPRYSIGENVDSDSFPLTTVSSLTEFEELILAGNM